MLYKDYKIVVEELNTFENDNCNLLTSLRNGWELISSVPFRFIEHNWEYAPNGTQISVKKESDYYVRHLLGRTDAAKTMYE